MKKLVCAMCAAGALAASAAVREYVWEAASPAASLGDDAAITLTGDAVSAMTLNVPKGDKAVLAGDALAFAANAKITIVGGGEFVFSNDVVTAGALAADGCCTNLVYTFDSLTFGNSLVFPSNVPLAALKPTGGIYSYNNDKTTYPTTGKPTIGAYFVHPKEDGSMTFQVQHDDGGRLRIVYCKLEEVSDGLKVTVVKYIERAVAASERPIGSDGKEQRIHGVYDYETPEGAAFVGEKGSGGALKGLGLAAQYARGVRTVEFAGKLTAGGKISMVNDAEVVLGRDAIGAEFTTPYDVTMGTMTFRDHGSFTNAATVTGTNGGIVYETSDFAGDFTADDYIATKSYEEISSPDDNGLPSTETVVFPNTSLAMITNVSATIDWRYYADNSTHQSDGVSRDLRAAEFVRFDTYAIVQFKAIPPNRPGISYAIVVRFDQRGNDVVARKVKGYRCWHEHNLLSNDPWTWPLDCTNTSVHETNWVHVWNLTAYSTTPVGHADRTTASVELTGTHTTEGVGLTVRPGLNRDTTLIACAAKSLPPVGGEVHVWERGTLSLHANLKTSDYRLNGIFTQENPTSLNFHPGSRGLTLRQTNNSCKQVINLDGADYLFWREDQGDISTSNPSYKLTKLDLYNYIGAINFANGARMTGWAPWIGGYLAAPVAAVTGQAPSVAADGLTMAFNRTQGEFAVEDVTGDAQVDFTVGLLRRNNSGDGWRKTGAGTMLLSKPLNYMGLLPVSVEEGCLLLGTSNCLTNGVGVALAGGTLGFAANTVNTNAELTVTANSTLALADGATAVFGDSSAQKWTPGTRLTVTGDPTTSRLSFGANGLTAAQLKQIRWSVGGKSRRVALGDEGEIVPYVPGAVLIVR